MTNYFFSILLLFLFFTSSIFAQINPDDITIIRDQWGVPHIYAKTDAQVVYGLAWASAEDGFCDDSRNFIAHPRRTRSSHRRGRSSPRFCRPFD